MNEVAITPIEQREDWPPLPVEGAVFERSRTGTLVLAIGWTILSALGMFLVTAALNGKAVGVEGVLFGIAAMIVAPMRILREIRSLWARRRLVVGSDCIQVIEQHGREEQVVLQLPFANIADFKYDEKSIKLESICTESMMQIPMRREKNLRKTGHFTADITPSVLATAAGRV